MNDPEVTMLQAPSKQLIALTTALEAAGIALSIARRAPAPLKSLADQVVRSATSVATTLRLSLSANADSRRRRRRCRRR